MNWKERKKKKEEHKKQHQKIHKRTADEITDMGTYPQNPDLHNVVGMNFHHIHKLTKNYPSANVSNQIITVNTITEIAMSINNKANKWHCCVRLKCIIHNWTIHLRHTNLA